MSNYEPLLQAHPVLHAIKKGLIMFDTVEYLNRKGKIKEKYFCMHTSGIYILYQKAFTKNYQVSRFIPLINLKKVFISDKQLTFDSPNDKITIYHHKHLKIASKVTTVFQTLFEHPSLKLEIFIEDKIRSEYEQQYFNYQPNNVLADRFIACILLCNHPFVENTIKETYDFLCTVSDTLNINSEWANNPYLQAIAQAAVYDHNIHDLNLKGFSMDLFSPYFHMFTTLNSTISKIYLKSIDFTHPLKSLDSLFTENSCIKAKEFRFKDCKFGSQAACDFFEAFTHYPSQIEILTFEICQFNEKSLDSFFQTLFFSNCFHNLQVFQIKDISGFDDLSFFLFQLVSCGWVLETHCLRYLGAPGCNLTLENLIPQILQLDTEFSDLDLSGNNFKTPIKTKFDINRSFTTLILKNVNFGPKSLLSLLKSLQKVNHKFNLDISNCKMSLGSWKEFYENCDQIKIQNLQSIIYDKNPLKPDNIQQFCGFIKNQPNLNSISISNCISKIDINSVVPQLTNLINSKSLESLTIGSTPENPLGGLILPIVFAALSKGTLKKLDISGQAGGERIMSQILQKMTSSLSEINFDGFVPSDGEAFLNICQSFMEKPYIKNIAWPGSDVKGCLARTNPQQRNDLAKKIQHLKTQFSNKYGHVDEKFDSIIDKNLKTPPNDKNSSGYEFRDGISSPPQDLARTKCSLAENYESMKDFVKYDPETELLIKECRDILGIDPVSKIFDLVNFHTQIDFLIQNIE